jgi:iron(III) transport system substrate-binding protein
MREWRVRLKKAIDHIVVSAILFALAAAYAWLRGAGARFIIAGVFLALFLGALYVVLYKKSIDGEHARRVAAYSRGRRGLAAVVAGVSLVFLLITVWRLVRLGTLEAVDVTVLSAMDDEFNRRLEIAFRNQAGLHARIERWEGSAVDIADRIRSEGQGVSADAFLGGSVEIHDGLARDGLLEEYLAPTGIQAASPDLNSPTWKGCWWNVLAFAYDGTKLPGTVHPVDLRWETLTDPRFRGRIALPDPSKTGAGVVFLATQVFRLNNDLVAVQRFLRSLRLNKAHYEPEATQPIHHVGQGQVAIGVAWRSDILRIKRQYERVKLHIPPDAGYEIGAVSILRYSAHPANARKFVDFMLGPQAAQLLADSFRYPLALTDVRLPVELSTLRPFDFQFVRYDRQKASQDLARLLGIWRAVESGR